MDKKDLGMTSPNLAPDRYQRIASPEERAIAIAIAAHQGQQDKAGSPFVYHLLRVMLGVEGSSFRQVAILHDLIEDTAWSADDLKQSGFSPEVIDAIVLLTRSPSDSYTDYVCRLSQNELAKAAKLADLSDNYRLDRVAFRPDHTLEDSHRIARYILSHDFLKGRISESEYRQRMQPHEEQDI